MPVTVPAMPLPALVDLVNEWGTVPRSTAGEQDQPYPPLAGRDFGVPSARPTHAAVVEVADLLHPVFAATDVRTRAGLVTAVLADRRVRPVVTATADRSVAAWAVERASDGLAAAAAIALRDHLDRHAGARLGTCTGRDCADVYVDLSPSHDRRYCSVTCQNRARVAAFRRRHAR